MDSLDDFMQTRPPTTARPLLGLTVLVVEDSRFASEAMRLLCLRSGARIRRADCLHHAHRHLRVYRPSVVIIDIGLPDGSGLDLIRDLAAATPRVDVLLGSSADDDRYNRQRASGEFWSGDGCASVNARKDKVPLPPGGGATGGRIVGEEREKGVAEAEAEATGEEQEMDGVDKGYGYVEHFSNGRGLGLRGYSSRRELRRDDTEREMPVAEEGRRGGALLPGLMTPGLSLFLSLFLSLSLSL